jgi:membrane dipeptidase
MAADKNSPLTFRTIVIYPLTVILVGLMIFIPAGTLRFWNGWLFIVALFVPMLFVLIYLMLKDPELLAKRIKTREKEKTQKIFLVFSIIVCLSTFLIPGFDYRFGWSHVPLAVVIISTLLMISGYFMFFVVMKQNTYASRVVEIQDEQKVIDTGLYSVIRHPMYSAGIIFYLCAPLVLGSWYAVIPALALPVLLVIRLLNEEKMLIAGLKGYTEYIRKVRFRLIPFIWVAVLPLIVINSSCNQQMDKSEKTLRQKAQAICNNDLIIDSHIDWPLRLMTYPEDISQQTEKGDFDYVRAKKGGLDAVLTVAYINSAFDVERGRAEVDSVLKLVNYYIKKYPAKFAAASSPDDIRKNFEKHLLSLPVCLENGSPVGHDLSYLQYLKDKGIVYMTLCHNRTNQICDSNFDTDRRWNGLSPFGVEVISEMNRLGIMIDISHSTDSTVAQALRYSKAPVVATHSLCREFAPGLERNLPDTLIKAIAGGNGVVMVNFGSYFLEPECMNNWMYLFFKWQDSTGIDLFSEKGMAFLNEYGKTHKLHSDAAKVADHIDHIVKVAGIDHVGIGSDLDGIDYAQPVDLPDVSAYPALVYELLKRGYTNEDIRKILSGNFLRVWSEVLSKV